MKCLESPAIMSGVTVVDIEVAEQASFSKVKALILMHRRGIILGPTHCCSLPIAHYHTHSAGATDADRRPCYSECRRKICLVGHATC